ncbi:MAG: phytoene/squalene synthase family protein, partial [Acidimicrobiales bacterium]
MNLESAYARCEEITRTEAKNFAYGIRLLPTDKRRAMSALYAFARRLDDIGDADEPADERLSRLAGARNQLAAVVERRPHPDDGVLVALADAAERYPIPLPAFGELIDGCEMDCRQSTYASFEELSLYCRRVAGSIGRLSLGVFGMDGAERRDGQGDGERLADTLGVALQVTNILRDVVED